MRVAVHLKADDPQSGGEDTVVAYRLGRVEDGVHNQPAGFEPIALEDYVSQLVDAAKAEYPDAEVVVERLVDNGDDTSRWIPAEEFDPEQHTPAGAGKSVHREVAAHGRARHGKDEG